MDGEKTNWFEPANSRFFDIFNSDAYPLRHRDLACSRLFLKTERRDLFVGLYAHHTHADTKVLIVIKS